MGDTHSGQLKVHIQFAKPENDFDSQLAHGVLVIPIIGSVCLINQCSFSMMSHFTAIIITGKILQP